MGVIKMYGGIDPGFSGAIGIIDDKCNLIDVIPCPLLIIKTGKKKIVNLKKVEETRKRVDGTKLAEILRPYTKVKFVIEHSQSMPGQGGVSIFNYGEGYGVYRGVLETLGIDYIEVSAPVWKSKMKLNSDKYLSIAMAQELIPSCKDKVKLRKDDGKAEACLLALYLKEFVK